MIAMSRPTHPVDRFLPTWARARSTFGWGLAGATLALAGAAWIARGELAAMREAFDTDARIAHRLLSQRAVQHEAILATLVLLQPADGGATERLPAVYPQVLRVMRRDAGADWPEPALAAAEEGSRRSGRALLAEAGLESGRGTLVQAGTPASFALQIDWQRFVPRDEWPIADGGPVRSWLELGGRQQVLQAGREGAGGVAVFEFTKHLAAESQPFDLRVQRRVGWADLPWAAMAAWASVVALGAAALAAAQRQRSERRRAEQLLRLGQVGRLNALGELAAGMAHELNQPLTALLANTRAAQRLLDDDPPELATARAAMGQAAEQARRAAEVVGRLRRVVQPPERDAAAVPVGLHDATRSVLYLLEPECARRGVDLRWEVPADAPAVRADPVALEQIVHNLVMNALQALEQVPADERRLDLAFATEGGRGVLRVRDHGPGIDAEHLARIFEPFFTTRPGGLGLGLSLCETLALGMGGTLTARRIEPRGAEFRLELPLAGEAAP